MELEDFKQFNQKHFVRVTLKSGATYDGQFSCVKARTKEGRRVYRLFLNPFFAIRNPKLKDGKANNRAYPRARSDYKNQSRSWEINKVVSICLTEDDYDRG